MKILISERQKNLLLENQLKDDLINIIKYDGWEDAIRYVGNIDNLKKFVNFDSPLDFLNLFNDLEVVQSVNDKDFLLIRYGRGNNIIVYNKKTDVGYVNYRIIWTFLRSYFDLKESEIKELTKEWLSDVYNLKVTKMRFTFLNWFFEK
jgi:hypothetical protein